MSITTANSLSIIRSLVGETTAKYWTDVELGLYQQMAMAKVLSQYGPWLFNKYKNIANLSTVAGTADYDYPTDCYKISYIQDAITGSKLRYVDDDEYWKYKGYPTSTVAWTHVGGKIRFIPTPSGTVTNAYIVWYLKNLDEVTDFPDILRALITVEAAILARTKDENVTADLINMKNEYNLSAMVELQTTNMHDVVEMGDFSEEDSLA